LNKKSSIILVIPYFGKWPIWFDAWLKSVAYNPTINWLCVTDCKLPNVYPDNLKFVTTSLGDLNSHVNNVVETDVPLNPRKFCDLKPAYGDIFIEYIKDYYFWGFCDMDVIFGNIRKFMTEDILANYDIISSRKSAISGHFNLFKNTQEYRTLFKKISNYKYLFEQPKFMWFDEHVLTDYLKKNEVDFKIKWDEILCNHERGRDSHQEYYINKRIWKNGEVYKIDENNNIRRSHVPSFYKLEENYD